MRKLMGARSPDNAERQFHSVAEAARIFGVSEMTMYRAIHEGQFPAVRIMGRLIVPARAIESIVDAALESCALVDVAEWVPENSGPADEPSEADLRRRQRDEMGRPRPGANQFGAGSLVAQQGADGEASSMTDAGFDGVIGRPGRSRTAGGVR